MTFIDVVFHQDQVIRRVNSIIHQLNGPSGYQLTRRPFRINWFINQLAMYVLQPVCYYHLMLFRCLVLWSHDTNLDDALKLAKSILIPIDVLNALWPCPGKFHYSSFKHFVRYWHRFQLFSKNVILCVNNSSKLVIPPMLSSHSLLATLFHPSCEPNMMHFFGFGQHLLRYVSKEHFDFCYLPSFSCSAYYATIRSLSCINKLDDIFIHFLSSQNVLSLFLHLLFFVSFLSPS